MFVVGAGPAGLAIASACAAQGLSVCCTAPDVHAAWRNNYGAWQDELAPLGLRGSFERTWSEAVVHFDARRSVRLSRTYGRIRGDSLREALLARAGQQLRLHAGAVRTAAHDADGTTLTLEDGATMRAKLVIDASGFAGRLLTRGGKPADAFQVAYGIMARVERHPYSLDEMGLMDFRDEFLAARGGPPTFLYAMPFSEDRVFLEETSLVCRPALDFAFHARRLEARLAALGIVVREVEFEEHCLIPMNGDLPDLAQRTLGFGAAAGFVHPASGYSVAHSLRLAPELASLLAVGLARGTPLDALSRDAWRLLWPSERLRMRRIHLLGLELFVRSRARGLRLFLSTFFRAPDAVWRHYLSGASTARGFVRSFLPRSKPPRLPS